MEDELEIDIYDEDLEETILKILENDKSFGNYNKRSQIFILNEGKNIKVGEESSNCPYCLTKNVSDEHIDKCEQEVNDFNKRH
jgi:hypothetical protein